jgi:hypothetical protein
VSVEEGEKGSTFVSKATQLQTKEINAFRSELGKDARDIFDRLDKIDQLWWVGQNKVGSITPKNFEYQSAYMNVPEKPLMSITTSKKTVTAQDLINQVTKEEARRGWLFEPAQTQTKEILYSARAQRGTSYGLGTATMVEETQPGYRVVQLEKWQKDIFDISKKLGFDWTPAPVGFGKTGTSNLVLYPEGEYVSGLRLPPKTIFKFGETEIKTPELNLLRTTIMTPEEGLKQYNIMIDQLVKRGYTAAEAGAAMQEKAPRDFLDLTRTAFGGKMIERYPEEVRTQLIPGVGHENVYQISSKELPVERATEWKNIDQFKIELARPTEITTYTGKTIPGGITSGVTLPKEKLSGFLNAFWENPKAVLRGETDYLYSALGKITTGEGAGKLVPTYQISDNTGLLKGVTKTGEIQSYTEKVPTQDLLNQPKVMEELRKQDPHAEYKLKEGIGKPEVWRTRSEVTDPKTGEIIVHNKYDVIMLDKQVVEAKQITKGLAISGPHVGEEQLNSYVLTKEITPEGKLIKNIETLSGPKIKSGTMGEKSLDDMPYQKYTDYNKQLTIDVEETPTGRFKKVINISVNNVVQEYPPWTKIGQKFYLFPEGGTSSRYIKGVKGVFSVPDILRAEEPPTMLFQGRQINPDAVKLERINVDDLTIKDYIRVEGEKINTLKDINGALQNVKTVNLFNKEGTEAYNVIRKDNGDILKFVSQDGRTLYPRNLVDMKVTKIDYPIFDEFRNKLPENLQAKFDALSKIDKLWWIGQTKAGGSIGETPLIDLQDKGFGALFGEGGIIKGNKNIIPETLKNIPGLDDTAVKGLVTKDALDNVKNLKIISSFFDIVPKGGDIYGGAVGGMMAPQITKVSASQIEGDQVINFLGKGGVVPAGGPTTVTAIRPVTVPTVFPSLVPIEEMAVIPPKVIYPDLSKVLIPAGAPVPTTVPVISPVPTTIPTTVPISTPVPIPTEVPVPVPAYIPTSTLVNVPVPVPVTVPIVTPVVVPVVTPIPTITSIIPTEIPYKVPQPLIAGIYLPLKKRKEEKKKKKPEGKGYEVFIRRRKKFVEAAPFAFPTKETAISYGARKVLSEAAATFQVRPSKKPIREVSIPGVEIGKYFRAPTGKGRIKGPDTFIQLERKRIITPGEKKEISFKGITVRAGRRIPTRFSQSFASKKRPINFLKSKTNKGKRTFF